MGGAFRGLQPRKFAVLALWRDCVPPLRYLWRFSGGSGGFGGRGTAETRLKAYIMENVQLFVKIGCEVDAMKISDLLKPSLIKLDLQSLDKEDLFGEMVQVFVDNHLISDAGAAVAVLKEREEKMSTGVGNGIGIPHGKLPGAKGSLLALGVSRDGIDYEALDGELVYIVITIFAPPDNPGQHVELLAEISRLFAIPGFAEKVRAAQSAEEVMALIVSEE